MKRAVLVASGIRMDGYREILGITLGDSESYTTWDEMFRWLKGRGLSGVVFVISDDHGGITKAVDKHFQGATWQRCQVHLMRNVLGHSPTRLKGEVAAAARLVLQAADMKEARRRLAEFVECLELERAASISCGILSKARNNGQIRTGILSCGTQHPKIPHCCSKTSDPPPHKIRQL